MLRDKLAKLGTSLSSKLRGVGGKIGDYLSFYACILAVGWEKVKVVIVCNSLNLFLFLTVSPNLTRPKPKSLSLARSRL